MLGDDSSEYHALNSGAHRKETVRFHAPALASHLAFWADEDAKNDIIQNPEQQTLLKKRLDFFICGLFQFLSESVEANHVTLFPKYDNQVILFANVYYIHPSPRFLVERKTPTSQQIDILSDSYRVIYVSCIWRGFRVVFRFELLTEYYTLTTFVQANAASYYGENENWYDKMRETLSLGPLKQYNKSQIEIYNKTMSEIRDYFYNKFWHELREALLPDVLLSEKASSLFKYAFADFRGMILCEHTIRFDFQTNDNGDAPLTWGSRAADILMPLINDADDKRECTASYMLGGRALYMTTLGPQPFGEQTKTRVPATYLFYVHQTDFDGHTIVNRWQLGRLITRLHLIGTVRLAALRKLDSLYKSGQILGELEPQIKNARQTITEDEKLVKASDMIVEANKTFNKIGEEDIFILYRIERSRYYVTQYKDNVVYLRLQRVNGFQRYDEFVFRRLGAAYDFIDRLGRRYERATQNLALLDQYFLTISANRISKFGEAVLFIALVPYYSTSLIVHLKNEDSSFGVYGYIIFIVSAIAGIWKYFDITEHLAKLFHHKKMNRESWYAVIKAVVLAGVLIVVAQGITQTPAPCIDRANAGEAGTRWQPHDEAEMIRCDTLQSMGLLGITKRLIFSLRPW